ncbi:hypothetical protein [Desulfoscipio geothermicus]|uniref:Helix-turn-helix domain-containing protein n=1 Tax=Desulfoscipio geothermicus DSM 3669 TaxID=1121426 RepID=A0A1I6E7D4_9FIRM|nr:hypothetical protein [Desulfoscipio geothermicus]SFR13659.1 hypothetical protein SAMN05660706_12848 [Desulfoscipio geothermicus DSM 3669]
MNKSPELLNPAQICETLGITPNGVNRLTREGYLEVKQKVNFKNGVMHLFHKEQVQALAPSLPRIKQAWERYDNYCHGASRLARARMYRQKSYQDKVKRKEQFFNNLALLPEDQEKMLKAAYYLFHLNHYAKAGSTYLYDLKELVLHTLVQNYYGNDDLLQVSFIEGHNKINLCPDCKSRAQKQRLSYLEYLDRTGGCPKCTREYKYYSLYEFIVSCEDYRFCFHTPYHTAQKWFDKSHLPRKKHTPLREGAYAFGRAIYDSEARAVELMEVIKELQHFLATFNVKPLIDTY